MSKWEYKSPTEYGYTKFKLTKKQHNEIFKNNLWKRKFGDKYEYYYNDQNLLLHRFNNWIIIIINTISFPLLVLIHGFANFKEIATDIKRLYSQKKCGAYCTMPFDDDTKEYKQVMKLLKEESE